MQNSKILMRENEIIINLLFRKWLQTFPELFCLLFNEARLGKTAHLLWIAFLQIKQIALIFNLHSGGKGKFWRVFQSGGERRQKI